MEPNNDFKSLFAVMAADWPICHTHMQASANKQNTQHCSQRLQSRRTVFPVTVKKSSSAKARNASSNISLVIAFGKKERNKYFTHIKYSFTCYIERAWHLSLTTQLCPQLAVQEQIINTEVKEGIIIAGKGWF